MLMLLSMRVRAAVNSTDKVLKRRGHAKIIYGQPLYPVKSTPTIPHNGNDAEGNETATILRKHTTLVAEWEAVQDESKVLREELKEDEWLTVFWTVTDQADRMMSSLEKGVNRCQVRFSSQRSWSPSRSMIPVPTLHLSSPSRPGSSMSIRARSEGPSLTFKVYAARSQTPESALTARAQQVPVYQGTLGRSFREASTSRAPSRSTLRTGAFTPSGTSGLPIHEYVPGNGKDPLDIEVAFVVNSIAHGLLVERVDPPLRRAPGENEKVKAQYAFSNALNRKVVTCKLTTLTRSGKSGMMMTKKVMCHVGGGWQDLSHYILNRQAGM
ncbi:hypothetical protein DFH05DRAFT_1608773 [Lentinula detonsa]|uniref:GAR domain-containing protein n=2 Tax=Lentinula TaxID=5352 RepID=A0A9W8TS97_9AGAR|nr:hypothetical protein DFH05DRAFT_1608773 [Lentinula detonsa]